MKDIDSDNILLNEKSYENVLVDGNLYRTLIGAKPLHIMYGKVDRFIRDNDHWVLKNILHFVIGLDIL